MIFRLGIEAKKSVTKEDVEVVDLTEDEKVEN